MGNITRYRKIEHIDICLNEDVESKIPTGFSDIILIHKALPELSLDEINVETVFLGKKLKAPIIITGMTGGHPEAVEINKALAYVAEKLKIGIGVGSQRAALEDPSLTYTYSIVKEYAQSTLKIANIGFVQAKKYSTDLILKAIDMIDADALAIHLNPLQESVQIEGEKSFKEILSKIRELSMELPVPVIVKETGAGICKEIASLIARETNVKAIDVAGLGGTSWSAVEMYRALRKKNYYAAEIAKDFWNWGIPTAISIIETRIGAPKLEVIGSGGVRTGLDIAKALAIGANVAGIALPALREAVKGIENLEKYLRRIIDELKIAMLLTGSKTLKQLRKTDVVVTGRVKEWLEQRGIDIREYLEKFR